MKIFNDILNLIYPCRCPICDEVFTVKRDYKKHIKVCDKCVNTLPYIGENYCIKCGKKIISDDLHDNCSIGEFEINRAYSVFLYNDIIKKSIYKFKYSARQEYAVFYAEEMYKRLNEFKFDYDLLVPVPISKKKLKKRGFNQAELLSTELSKNLNIDTLDILTRFKDTKAQKELSKHERKLNLKNAFGIKLSKVDLKNKKILLIDDIFTTGVTINECSKILKMQGASVVDALTIATGICN